MFKVRFRNKSVLIDVDTPFEAVSTVLPKHEVLFCNRLGDRFDYVATSARPMDQFTVNVYPIVSMAVRKKHCAFSKLNSNGRCIASCHLIKNGTDCIGMTGKTMDSEFRNEVRITGHAAKCINRSVTDNSGSSWGGGGKVPAIYRKGSK
jgi:hypothetical protein